METLTDSEFPTQRTTSDCFSACLSWLLGLPQDEVPDFTDPDDARSGQFYRNLSDWLRPRGLRLMMVEWRDMPPMLGGPIIVRGISPREKAHAVLWDDNGLLHDPHPSRAGLIGDPTHAMLILVSRRHLPSSGEPVRVTNKTKPMPPKTLEECLTDMRRRLKELEMEARSIVKCDDLNPDHRPQTFEGQCNEQKAQAMLAVRHIEDARMRLGKVIQYNGDGVSCYDK
jgi:hypothetical protein